MAEATRPVTQRRYQVEGLCCAEEVNALRKTVGTLDGVEGLDCNLLQRTMTVTVDEELVDERDILRGIEKAGMRGREQGASIACSCCDEDHGPEEQETWWTRHGRSALCGLSGLFLLAGFVVHWALHGGLLHALTGPGHGSPHQQLPWSVIVLYALAVLAGGWHVFPKAWKALKTLRADMNLLMTIAAFGAMAIGEWMEAATVLFLFAVSLMLESWSVGRARRAIGELLDLAPDTARIVPEGGGEPQEIAAGSIEVGQRIVVRPGERLPLDGEIVRGSTSVDQAPITGESMPVDKGVGDEVFAGTINQAGAIEVRVTQPSANTTLARIGKLVEQAQGRRSPSEQWVDRFAARYTPAMIGVALLVAVVPPLAFGGVWTDWLYEALVILVIACPCALVISTPVSVVSALSSAARNGVLIKGGVALEAAAGMTVLAMDKTGTLTRGEPAVQTLVPLDGHTADELLTIAAAVEANSEHPIGRAIVTEAQARGLTPPATEDFQAIKGKGATAVVDGRPFWVGSHAFLHERLETPDEGLHQQAQRLADAGHSLVAIGNDRHVCGLISLADAVRDEARASIDQLHRSGVRRIMMLTGDNRETARAIAEQLGIDEVHAELLPEDKLELVAAAGSDGQTVAMAGDGINDAPALATADLGIAMGTGGSDAAIETADIALMTDDLGKLPWLVGHARRTLRIIKQNVAFALGVKAVFMLLAILHLATLWMAIAADMGASLLVTFNALRLLGSEGNASSG